jgi:hypothetical protein
MMRDSDIHALNGLFLIASICLICLPEWIVKVLAVFLLLLAMGTTADYEALQASCGGLK